MTYAAEVLADAPLAYYRLGEASGTTMVDSSGNGRNGTYTGPPTLGDPGLIVDADDSITTASGQYGEVAHAAWQDPTTAITYEAWVKVSSVAAGGKIFLGRSNLGSLSDANYQAYIWQNGPTGFAFTLRNAGGTVTDLLGPANVVVGQVYHVVGTYDGAFMRLYVNGVQIAAVAKTGSISNGGANTLRVSRVGSTSNTFIGGVDEAAMYDTALSAARVARHYLVGIDHALLAYDTEVAADSPLAHWPLAETSGTTMVDSSGNSRNGVIDAGVSLNQSSIVPSLTDGTWELNAIEGGEVAVASWMGPAAAFSAEAWFRPTSFAGNGAVIIGRADPALTNSAANKPWYAFCTNAGLLQARVYNNAGTSVLLQSAAAVFALNTVHHVVITHDGTTARAYVNGAQVAAAALGGVPVSTTTSTKNLTVGRDDAAGTYTLTGKVQQAAFYGAALSGERVRLHYLSGIYGADVPAAVDITLDGDLGSFTGTFDLEVTADVALDGDLGSFTGLFTLAGESTDLILDGDLGSFTGTFDLEAATPITLDGDLGPFTGTFPLLDPGAMFLDGTLGPFTGEFDLEAVPISEVTLDGDLGPFTGSFTIDNPITGGERDNRVGGRDRQGIAIATWEPTPVEPPHGPAFLNFDVALAFTEPVITETAPPLFTATGAVKPRPIDQIIVGGRDVTFFRGAPTPFPGFARTEPFGYGPTVITFPQIAGAFEKPGAGALRWLRPGVPVTIRRIETDSGDVVAVDYRGLVVGFDLQGASLSVQVGGELTGRAAMMNRQPPIFPRTNDTGFFVYKAIRELGLKSANRSGPNTEVTCQSFGGTSMLEYLSQLVAMTFNRSGNRWTCTPPTGKGTYRMRRKDTTTIRGTVYADDGRTVADIHRDIAEEPNRIFMQGVTPDGQRERFAAFPGLKQTPPPPYPMNDNSSFGPGTTDADTDTGDGITIMINRLRGMKYLDFRDQPGGFDADASEAIEDLQADAGLGQTGNMNPATWRALFDISITGFSLRQSRILPAADRRIVRQYLRSSSGAVIARNPTYDATVPKVDRNIDVGSGFNRGQMRKWARAELQDSGEDNWVGTITFNTGALIDGIHTPGDAITPADLLPARDLREGDNLWLPLMNGGDGLAFHVSGVTVSPDGIVSATVDTRARDDGEVWEAITRNRESRNSPYREWLRDRRASTVTKDATTPWDPVGGRLFERIDIPANTWVVFPVVGGQEGQIRTIEVNTNPNAEFVLAVTGQRIRATRLQHLIGNPLSGPGRRRWEKESVRDLLDRTNVLLYVAGSDTEPCGYYPKTKTGPGEDEGEIVFSPPLTGRWKDEAGVGYRTAREPVLYVAVYADRATSIPAGRIMWQQLEAGT